MIECSWQPPHLSNANGGDIFLYPAFVVFFVDTTTFALLEYSEVALSLDTTRFVEEEQVPADARVVGATWAKTNKDGSPDRRFKDNYQIPIAEYAKIVLTSRSGLHEEYMVSNVPAAAAFHDAWRAFIKAVRGVQ